MIFGEFPLEECEGLLLAHSLRHADGIFKKGRRLASADFSALAAAGIDRVHGARLEPGDLDENAAAGAVAATLTGPGIAARASHAGRCNLYATQRGLVRIDAATIDRINAVDEAVTVATLPPLAAVRAGAVVATVKVIPLAVGGGVLDACRAAVGRGDAVQLLPFQARRAALAREWRMSPLRSAACSMRDRVAGLSVRPRVYFEEWDEPMISGIRWVSELIEIAGGIDTFPALAVRKNAKNRIVTGADVMAAQPDIIIGSWCGKKFVPAKVASRPGLDTVPAVRDGWLREIKSPLILQPALPR